MRAGYMVKKYGKALKGRGIITPAMGAYPGGEAVILQIRPDKNAPEIVMNVKHPTLKDEEGGSTMGIFEYEDCQLAPATSTPEGAAK